MSALRADGVDADKHGGGEGWEVGSWGWGEVFFFLCLFFFLFCQAGDRALFCSVLFCFSTSLSLGIFDFVTIFPSN